MDESKASRRNAARQYKERKQIGGVCMIRNKENGKCFLCAEPDIDAARNRFTFSQNIGGCTRFELMQDWKQYGPAAFAFSVLEELEKKSDQDARQFKSDLDDLLEMKKEQLGGTDFY